MKRKVLSVLLATAMVATMAGCGNTDAPAASSSEAPAASSEAAASTEAASSEAADEIVKPDHIKVTVDGTVVTPANGQAEFEAQLEEALGGDIDIEFDSQDHSAYADAVSRIFASGDWPDVILLSSAQYAAYAKMGALWDMTDAYANASFQDRLVSSVNDYLKIDGVMYGMSAGRGNGCQTYVKKAWMDAVGITEAPTTYDEYYDMLKKFTTEDPDGDGVNDTYGVASAKLIGDEAPYINYLPEFYQDAYPDFLQDESGVWYDGFDTDAMQAALERLQTAYADGVIDPESLTMGTKDARNKFYDDQFGVFTYWAGTWERNLMNNLEAQELPTDLVRLEPLEEMGSYIERQTGAWAITTACENPEGVFKYFLEPMLDGSDVQFLWTYGAKGTHWDNIAEDVTVGENTTTYAEGEFHMLPTPEKPDTLMTKNHIDPLLAVAPLDEAHTVAAVDEVVAASNQFFMDNAVLAPMIPSSDLLNEYNGDIWDIKRTVVTKVVVEGEDAATWMQYYRDNVGSMAEEILAELNQ